VPRLESVTLLGGGVVQLRFTGGTGQSIITEASGRLPDWVPVFTNVPNGGAIQFSDPGAAGVSGRFYRLKVFP
jgi:hypothetical protein